ncbi:hypothetical protein C4J87_1013 [Pseudomonas sp. R1-43-08]|nr:hypothetical protein C4J91_1130 [Pseudomonas sp. R3-52-08]AZF25228.1 hypothetical protein C4J90_1039 [Pseudomonas sp. R2-60-08W]AZF30550.1 hypothetical protein C4J89_1059 [Pseudomonas sp. R4-35-07]AZF41188.1 hypothetical protein C4J87_1013 [Pseudomonas sp. R1-43-08]AZF46392.1 hypothetical protein C4J86_1141 [Pseudomonas sp. R2-7-07]
MCTQALKRGSLVNRQRQRPQFEPRRRSLTTLEARFVRAHEVAQ